MFEESENALAVELRRLWAAAERRAAVPIKVSTFAKELFISPSSLYAYLAGTTLPPLLVLDRIAQALGATPAEQARTTHLHEAADRHRSRRRRAEEEPLVAPCQVPPAVRHFTGRADQLAELTALAAEPSALALVSGTAGVGKTALVAYWAHQVRDRFADGMLYVDLRGFDPEQPLEPGHVLGTFLRGLGVAADAIPGDVAERTALFRARLDRRRALVFLDNAVSEDQVRPLLPNSPHSVVVVTSRNTLPGLVARDGAHRVEVPSLPVADAVTLLRRLIGEERVGADTSGAAALVERCARLPLAIRIGADLAATRRRAGLTELAGELHRYHLDLFNAGGDERTAIRAVFSWSYLHLRTDRSRAFRLLGLHPGQDLDLYTCAALLDTGVREAAERIVDLVRANLLEEAGDARYRMHDLLRAYAREQASHDESDDAMHRLLDHYLTTTAIAMALVLPDSYTVVPPPSVIHPLSTPEEALSWLDAERRNLLTLAELAANEGWPACAVHMSALLYRYLDDRAHYTDAMTLHTLALKVARTPAEEGWAKAKIGTIHMRLGHHVEAKDHLEHALAMSQDVPDPRLAAHSLLHLAQLHLRLSEPADARSLLHQALPLTRDVADRHLEGHTLTTLALAHNALGAHDEALRHHESAVQLATHLRDDDLRGQVLNNLGNHHQYIGSAVAESYHRAALRIAHATGNRALEADASLRLGTALRQQSRPEEAQTHLTTALTIAQSTGDHTTAITAAHLLDQGGA